MPSRAPGASFPRRSRPCSGRPPIPSNTFIENAELRLQFVDAGDRVIARLAGDQSWTHSSWNVPLPLPSG